ncbi:MAG: helix-hairpin-helix domain-containing protein, partial [Candidatus Udaeobacter sp.]
MKSISIRHQKPARDVEPVVSSGKRRPHSSRISRRTSASPNVDIAGRLDEVANIFAEQGANRFRVQAYRRAANVLRRLSRSVADIFREQGIE